MTTSRVETARSFIIALYTGALEERGRFAVPLAVAAPFANRLMQETLREQAERIREPWYILIPQTDQTAAFQRTPTPVGPTSIHGQRYVPETEPPPRVALHPQSGIRSFTVQLLEYQQSFYEGQYGVDDIFQAWAELLARRLIEQGRMRPDEGPFYYAVENSAQEVRNLSADLFPAEAYEVEGVFKLPALSPQRERTVFTKVASQPLAVRDAETYRGLRTMGAGAEENNGLVLLREDVYSALHRDIELSTKVENGGYLLGVPFRRTDSAAAEDAADFRWLLEVTDVVPAEAAWGRRGSLLFTGETWSRMTRLRDREHPDKKLVGWFHTHLFKSSEKYGLSGLDQDLHRRFLTKAWQIAVLININAEGARTVRCFQRGADNDLVECRFQVFAPVAREEGVST